MNSRVSITRYPYSTDVIYRVPADSPHGLRLELDADLVRCFCAREWNSYYRVVEVYRDQSYFIGKHLKPVPTISQALPIALNSNLHYAGHSDSMLFMMLKSRIQMEHDRYARHLRYLSNLKGCG